MWDIRYRPLLFSEVLGQEGAVRVLQARLKAGTALDVSYIFSGGSGQGKTTLGRILARALLCQDLREDSEPCNACGNCTAILSETAAAFSELDAASNGTISNIRAIVDDLPFVIPDAPTRVYLFDEAHRMSRDAQDVLLKPIEDKKLVGIFCTTEPEKIRSAIKSRCEEYAIRKVTREEIQARMEWILGQEKVAYETGAILTVIDYCCSHVRAVINKLEMLAQMGPITEKSARDYLNLSVVSAYYKILLSLGDPSKAVQLVEQVCDHVGFSEVSGGVAEAAMNSYRLAHGMFADFTLVDRSAAQDVYDMYGDSTLKLAEYFLRGPRTNKVSLICDILACAKGAPQLPSAQPSATPPVQVTATLLPSAVPALAKESLEDPAVPEPAKELQEPTAVSEPAKESDEAPVKDPLSNPPLTEHDAKGIPASIPRGAERGDQAKAVFLGSEEQPPDDFLPPLHWRRMFADAWTHSNGGIS